MRAPCDAASAEWRHVHQKRPPRAWLGGVSYEHGKMVWSKASGAPEKLRAEEANADASKARFDSALAELESLRAHDDGASSSVRLIQRRELLVRAIE